jgi:hypothetical protein
VNGPIVSPTRDLDTPGKPCMLQIPGFITSA